MYELINRIKRNCVDFDDDKVYDFQVRVSV